MKEAEAQSARNASKLIEERFAAFCDTADYNSAVKYIETLQAIPAGVIDYTRSLGNPRLYEKAGSMILHGARIKGIYHDCIDAALEFLYLAAVSDDSETDRAACWQRLAEAHCRPELGRLDISKAIDCYEKMIINAKEDSWMWLELRLRDGLFFYLTRSTDGQDVKYAMDRIIKLARRASGVWTGFLRFLAHWQLGHIEEKNIFNMSAVEIYNLPIPGLTEDGCIDTEGFKNGRKWLSPSSLAAAVPHDAEAGRIVREAALEGDESCAHIMARHYHATKQYDKVLEMSRHIGKRHYGHDETLRLLASMYQNGQGVEQDLEKARGLYMECVARNRHCGNNDSDFYNLGEIHRTLFERHGRTADLVKACRFYKAIISPIHKVRDRESYRKYGTAFRELYRYCSSDTLRLTVKVGGGGVCAFQLRVVPVTCLAVDWGEKDGAPEHIMIGDSPILSMTEEVTFRHQYKKGGVYRIKIVTEGAYCIDSIRYPNDRRQLRAIDTSRCPALKTFVAAGQMLEKLDFSKNIYLHGVICSDNRLTQLDLRQCPTVTHLDCSCNPELKDLLYDYRAALTVLCAHGNDNLPSSVIHGIRKDVLAKNRGKLVEDLQGLSAGELTEIDMRLEYYVRLSQWDRLVPFLKKGLKHEFAPKQHSRLMDELERAFRALKALDTNDYHLPYKSGYLAVMDTYVSVEDLCGERYISEEEFFITEHPWTECMAMPVRYGWHREPWMRFSPVEPEYYVACCLVNMISNEKEKEKYIYDRA